MLLLLLPLLLLSLLLLLLLIWLLLLLLLSCTPSLSGWTIRHEVDNAADPSRFTNNANCPRRSECAAIGS